METELSDLSPEEIENRKIRRLQMLVHFTTNLLYQRSTTLEEAIQHVQRVRQFALKMFPGKERAWEMLYAPRFHRILKDRWNYVSRKPEDMVS